MNEDEFVQQMYWLSTLFNSGKITSDEYNKRAKELVEELKIGAKS